MEKLVHGKTYLLKQILHNIIYNNIQARKDKYLMPYNFCIIDPKCVDFQYLYNPKLGTNEWSKSIPPLTKFEGNTQQEKVWDFDEGMLHYHINTFTREQIENTLAKSWLDNLIKAMNIRYSLMKEDFCADWTEYRNVNKLWLYEANVKFDKTEEYMQKHNINEKTNIYLTKLLRCYRGIVVIVDELADLFYYDKMKDKANRKYEEKVERETFQNYLVKIATLGRAAGIHLILGTQRPDATILTGQLRANIPTRIALKCVSNKDKEIILGVTPKQENMDVRANIINYKSELYYFDNREING